MNGEALRLVLDEQRQLLSKYEALVLAYEKSDLVKENQQLKEDLEKLKDKHKDLTAKYETTYEEAEKLRWSLQEQILSEKIALVDRSQAKAKILCASRNSEAVSKLKCIEQQLEVKMNTLHQRIRKEIQEDESVLLRKLQILRDEVNAKILEKQREVAEASNYILNSIQEQYQQLKDEPLTEEVLENRIKANNLEIKIGLHWINKIGILVILIGIVTMMRYSFTYFMSAEVKGLFGLILTIMFLVGGEICARKDKRIFSQGLIGGGIGIGYITIFCSYFMLGILHLVVALGLCILISAIAFGLSIRYNSKTIAILGLMGGYLPLIVCSIMDDGIQGALVYMSMGYVCILNGVTLFIGYKKRWPIMLYFSYFTNMPTMILLVLLAQSNLIAIIYLIVHIAMYITILFIDSLRHKDKLNWIERIILGINLIVGNGLIWLQFYTAEMETLLGMVAVILCITYYSLSILMNRLQLKDDKTQGIFNKVALMFAILCMPYLVEGRYVPLGWLLQGLIFIICAYKLGWNKIEKAGKVIFGLAIGSLYIMITVVKDYERWIYYISYTSLIMGMIIVLGMYLYRHKKEIENRCLTNIGLVAYKYLSLLLLWGYLLKMGSDLLTYVMPFNSDVLTVQLLGIYLISVVILRGMRKIKLLYDPYIWQVTVVGLAIIDLICMANNILEESKGSYIICAVIIIWNIIDILDIRQWFREVVVKFSFNVELYPLVVASYIIVNSRIIMENQLGLGFHSVVVTLFYLLSAFILIICGFRYGYRWIRYSGLTLSLLALTKLFIMDIGMGVEGMYRIMAYFCFGIILLVISYIYQKYSKQIESELPKIIGKEEESRGEEC